MSNVSQPKLGPRRVAAWIHTVINPLIDRLRQEEHFLQKGNLSWRYHSQRFEYIRPIHEYIEPNVLPNLEDFKAENPAFSEKLKQHDDAVAVAEGRATALYRMLLDTPAFQKHVAEDFKKYESEIVSSQPPASSIESIKEHLPKFVAENLINKIRELPSHYTIHAFWKSFGNHLQAYLSEFDRHAGKQPSHDLDRTTANLKEISSALTNDFESLRLSLSREFDVPWAPPSTAHPAKDMFSY